MDPTEEEPAPQPQDCVQHHHPNAPLGGEPWLLALSVKLPGLSDSILKFSNYFLMTYFFLVVKVIHVNNSKNLEKEENHKVS